MSKCLCVGWGGGGLFSCWSARGGGGGGGVFSLFWVGGWVGEEEVYFLTVGVRHIDAPSRWPRLCEVEGLGRVGGWVGRGERGGWNELL